MSNNCISDHAAYYPSITQKYHDLTMMYLEKNFKFSKSSPSDLIKEYMKVYEDLRSTYKKLKTK